MMLWARGASRVYHLFDQRYLGAGIDADTGQSWCGTAWSGDRGLLVLRDVSKAKICKKCLALSMREPVPDELKS